MTNCPISYQLVYQYDPNITPTVFFSYFCVIPLMGVLCMLFWPMEISIGGRTKESEPLMDAKKEKLFIDNNNDAEDEQLPQGRLAELLHPDTPLLLKIKSPEFLLLVLFATINNVWHNMYIGTVQDRIEEMTPDQDEVTFLVQVMTWVLPMAFIVSPVVGWIVENQGLLRSAVLLNTIAFMWVGLAMVYHAWLQILTFCLYSLWRAFFFTVTLSFLIKTYATAAPPPLSLSLSLSLSTLSQLSLNSLSTLSLTIPAFHSSFGFGHFGQLWGVTSLVTGAYLLRAHLLTLILSPGAVNFVQYGLLYATYEYFHGSFLFVDIIQLITIGLTCSLPFYLFLRDRTSQRSRLE